MKLIVMDVRRTKVAEQADIHLQPRGGTDGAVAWGMMRVLIKEGLVNKPFIDKWCVGYDELVAYAEKFTPEYVEKESGVPAELVVKAARMFAEGPSGITISGQSIMHQHNGCNNARACSAPHGPDGQRREPGRRHAPQLARGLPEVGRRLHAQLHRPEMVQRTRTEGQAHRPRVRARLERNAGALQPQHAPRNG